MTAESNLVIVRAWVEQIWNASQLDQLARFHPPTFDNHGKRSTIEESKQWHRSNRTTFPDIAYIIDEIFASEDRVALRWSATATHQGMLWNLIPATGKTIHWQGMHMLRLAEGRIVEVWAVQNSVAQLQQMGVRLQAP